MANYIQLAPTYFAFSQYHRKEKHKDKRGKKKTYVQKKKKNYFLLRSIPANSDVTEIYAPSNMKTIITWGIVFIYKCA